MSEPDLNFLARQMDRVLSEVGGIRDDIAVLTAMMIRHEGTMQALLRELHATHMQITRMNDRVRKLEDAEITS